MGAAQKGGRKPFPCGFVKFCPERKACDETAARGSSRGKERFVPAWEEHVTSCKKHSANTCQSRALGLHSTRASVTYAHSTNANQRVFHPWLDTMKGTDGHKITTIHL